MVDKGKGSTHRGNSNIYGGNYSLDPSEYGFDEWETFYADYSGRGAHKSGSLWNTIDNWFSGSRTAAREKWEAYWNRKNVEDQAKAEYELNRLLRQTEYQDAVKSMEAAGLNPYALMTGNGFSTTQASVNTSAAKNTSIDSTTTKGKGLLAALAIMIKIIASL